MQQSLHIEEMQALLDEPNTSDQGLVRQSGQACLHCLCEATDCDLVTLLKAARAMLQICYLEKHSVASY